MKTNLQLGIAPLIMVLIIGAIGVIAAGSYYVSTRSGSSPMESTTAGTESATGAETTSEGAAIPEGEFTGNIEDIIGRGQNVECDIKNPVASGAPFTGKMWGTGPQGRSQINTTIGDGLAMEANAIYKDGTVYTWSYMNNNLVMAKTISQSEAQTANDSMTDEEKQKAMQYRQEMVFNCRAWTPDASKFALPSGVEFTEMDITP